MKKLLTSASLILLAAPAYAVEGAPLFSLRNTNFVVGIAFVAFVALLIYMGIPKKIGGMLDARAKGEAEAAAAQAKVDLKASIARRMTAAADQIDSSVKAAERAVRDQAISVSVAVAADVLKRQMTAAQANASIDASIEQVAAKLH